MKFGMCALLTFAVFQAGASPKPAVPVRIGLYPNVDACTSNGIVSGAKRVNLRTGPGKNYSIRLVLKEGQELHLCSSTEDEKWEGIVLWMDGILDCGVSSGVDKPQDYAGPCISGWINSKYVTVTAG